MKISEFKKYLSQSKALFFVMPNGAYIPPHFHLTEVGTVVKKFIDCGGTVREEAKISCQLWTANDFEHRLSAEKALEIISSAENELAFPDLEVEVEYQSETIGRYGLFHQDNRFHLTSLETDCLAKEKCGIPEAEEFETVSSGCNPESGCC